MPVEHKLSEVLSEFARTVATDFAIQSILDRLVRRIVDVLPITGAGVALISPGEPPAYFAASDDSALRFEQLQTELDEGPCLGAYTSGEAILIPDLAVDDRFPVFGPSAVDVGLKAVFTFPLRHGPERLGALDLYRNVTGALSGEQIVAAQTLADVAAAYLINASARADMEASEARYRWIVDTSQEGILILDLDGVITFANPTIASMLGTGVAEVVGRSLFEFVEPAELDAARHRLLQHRRGVSDPYDFAFRRADGTQLDVIVSASPRLDAGSIVSAVLMMVTDVSARKRAEASSARLELEGERAQQLAGLGQLAGGIAHDFNNLLGVISNYAALIKAEVSDEQTLSDLQEIDNATILATALTRQLLAYARQDVVEPCLIDVNRLLRRFNRLLHRTLGAQIRLYLDLDESTPDGLVVLVDPKQLEQVLLNIAINARDAVPDGGDLTTTTQLCTRDHHDGAPSAWVRIRITDTGSGMPPAVVAQAFEPFFTTKPLGSGTGLGLATAYGIVTRAGGEITINSVPGQGTTIELMFPFSNEPADVGPQQDAPIPRKGQERILLVDDEDALRRATERVLASFGYQVVAVSDGDEALAVLDASALEVDLVLTDVVMKRMSGIDLARQVAERHPDLPVIFMSGYANSDTIPDGAVVLQKPVRQETLGNAVRDAIERSHAEPRPVAPIEAVERFLQRD